MADKGDKPIGKREAQRAQIRDLHAAGKTPAQIAKALKVTESAVRQRLKKMGLSDAGAPPAATSSASGVVTLVDLAKFLKEIGADVTISRADGSCELDGKVTDAIGLLEHANAWRRRNKQPLLTLKRG